MTAAGVTDLLGQIADLGRDPGGGWTRPGFSPVEADLRAWFLDTARSRGLSVTTDRNGNLWAETDPDSPRVLATGSHLDSVPGGGPLDGPLGIACGFAALDLLATRRPAGTSPGLAVVAWAEEEGSGFGMPCLGSRLATGTLTAGAARALTAPDGTALAPALAAAGIDPDAIGPDPERLARLEGFVEVHVEQGLALAPLQAPLGLARGIVAHGRWRLDFTGRGDHAGTAALASRSDPALTLAFTVLAARKIAARHGGLATVGRQQLHPNATNAVPSRATGWLDARAGDPTLLDGLVADLVEAARTRARRDGTGCSVTCESLSAPVEFPAPLTDRVQAALGTRHGPLPRLLSGAGHDAGVLAAAGVPAAMLLVRNPTGVSHAPEETAAPEDCEQAAVALADALAGLAGAGIERAR